MSPRLRPLPMLLLAALPLAAQVPCSPNTAPNVVCVQGNVSDVQGGGPLNGGVYHVVGPLTVPGGETLTVMPGTIVKVGSATGISVFGTLSVGAGALFSSIHDDSAGGDTNGNGNATVPGRGSWNSISMIGGTISMAGAELRFGAGIFTSGGQITLTSTTIREHAGAAALDLFINTTATVTGCQFNDGDHLAVKGVSVTQVPNFTGNSASGNAEGDYLRIDGGFIPVGTPPFTIGPANALDGAVLVLNAGINVPAGTNSHLTIGNGAILKMTGGGSLAVSGRLTANGVMFTSLRDDSQGGDTNKDGGATVPAPGDWFGLAFFSSADTSILSNGNCRYAGGPSGTPSLQVNSDMPVHNFVVERGAGDGMNLLPSARPTVTNCIFADNNRIAVTGVAPLAVPGFTGNSASGNAVGDYLEVETGTAGAITVPLTWTPANTLNDNGLLVVKTQANSLIQLSAPSGHLTLAAGLVLKFKGGNGIAVDSSARLTTAGTGTAPVVMTSIHDDSILGDSNKNGAQTVAAPGDWAGLAFAGDLSVLAGARIRFAGGPFAGNAQAAAVRLSDADIAISDCIIDQSPGPCLDLGGNSFPNVNGCSFRDSLKAVANSDIEAPQLFLSNTGSGNQLGSFIEITTGHADGPTTSFSPANAIQSGQDGGGPGEGVFVIADHVVIDAGAQFVLAEGVIFKFKPGFSMTVNGELHASSENGGPVVLTSIDDDSVGGDTENNGAATSPAPGQWQGVTFGGSAGASTLDHTTVRFGGTAQSGSVRLNGADVTIRNSQILDGVGPALHLGSLGATAGAHPTVAGCNFQRCGIAVDFAALSALPGFTNCTASQNATGDCQRIRGGSLVNSLLIRPLNTLNQGPVIVADNIDWPAGTTLTIDPGMILKMEGARRVIANGTLTVPGAAAGSITLTSVHDDQVGGDTNKNGNTTSTQPGDWNGLEFGGASDASVVTGLLVRYAGSGGAPAVDCSLADIVFNDSTVELCQDEAIDLSGSSLAQIRRCRLQNNGGRAMDGVLLRAVPAFIDNVAAGNGRDEIRVTGTAFSGTLAISRQNANNDGGVLEISTSNITADSTDRLILNQGVILKWSGGAGQVLNVNGALDVRGTGLEPVVLTRIEDDAFGGDTNKDGNATVPQPGGWRGVLFSGAAQTSLVEHARVRFAGASGNLGAIQVPSAAVTLRSARADRSLAHGFHLARLAANATNLVAFQCGGRGVNVASPAGFDVIHASVTGCGAEGIAKTAALPGNVVSSISFGNTGTNFSGFQNFEIISSNGSAAAAGTGGNIDLDPLFTDPAGGDLTLQAGSPCLNTADLLTVLQVKKDHVEASRALDHDLTGASLPDMGAFERAVFSLAAGGRPRLATTMGFTVQGPPGTAVIALGALDGDLILPPFGIITVGDISTLIPLAILPVGQTLFIDIPASAVAIVGLTFGVQGLASPAFSTAVGNVTNLFRGTVFN